MRRLFLLVLLSSFVPAGAVTGTASARETSSLRVSGLSERIASRLRKAGLVRSRYGVVVLTRGARPRPVFVHGASRALVPASAAKLLTSATALDLLGPSHRFRTRVTARGEGVAEGVLDGDLVVHGGGDPNISGRFHDGQRMRVLDRMARDVVAAGIRTVTGALVLDEGGFDRDYVHPDWSRKDRQRWYGAPVGGLSFNDNCIDVRVRGTKAGKRAAVDVLSTAGPWRIVNEIRTKSGRSLAGGTWAGSGDVLHLSGRAAPGDETSFHVPVHQPALFFGGALRAALEHRGVTIDGGIRLARDLADRRPGRLVAEHDSGMLETLAVVNQNSQNFYASMLFKACGVALTGQGTWRSGERAVREMLARRNIAPGKGLSLRDGSGLSPENKVSAGLIAQVLASFDGDVLRGPVLAGSLAVSGEAGTLRRRLRARAVRGRVRAKTGTLNDTRARALAGYVEARSGGTGYVFAILLNGRGASHGVIDEVVRELCR